MTLWASIQKRNLDLFFENGHLWPYGISWSYSATELLNPKQFKGLLIRIPYDKYWGIKQCLENLALTTQIRGDPTSIWSASKGVATVGKARRSSFQLSPLNNHGTCPGTLGFNIGQEPDSCDLSLFLKITHLAFKRTCPRTATSIKWKIRALHLFILNYFPPCAPGSWIPLYLQLNSK